MIGIWLYHIVHKISINQYKTHLKCSLSSNIIVPMIHLRDVHGFKPGTKLYPFLHQVPVMVTVKASTSHATSVDDSPRRTPR